MPTHSLCRACAAALLLGLSGPSLAHVVMDPDEATANTYFRTKLRVPHGCEGSPTVALRVKVPDGVMSAKPEMKPGWTVSLVKKRLDQPIDGGHGRSITEVVDEVVWRGGPLPDEMFDEFGLVLRLPAKPGETLWFRTVQECESGVHRWIEIPAAGQAWGDARSPAPFVRLRPAP